MAPTLPLAGIRVLELAGLAPAPFAGLVLADFGADVVRVDRADASFSVDVLTRGKRSLAVSLKSPEGIAILRKLLEAPSSSSSQDWRADILIDPFRPGVLERLGLDPKELLARNPRLIVVRLTGFRREGVYAKMAGHDINYLALSGVLSMLGRKGDKPYAPANIIADFAGGGMLAALGVMAALFERSRSGKGQVIETDMVTGTRYASLFPLLMSRPSLNLPMWNRPRGENILDSGAPWYDVYETKDGKYMSLGPIENHFYAVFLDRFTASLPREIVPSPPPTAQDQLDRSTWPGLTSFLTAGFLTKTRDEWTQLFLGTDACCVPVLEKEEIDPRGVGPFEEERELDEAGEGGYPVAAPRLTRTPATSAAPQSVLLAPGKHTMEVLEEAGMGREAGELLKKGAVGQAGSESRL
ncbi:hypothetical protein JCM8097_007249 [Rhodosporidiobolus ruineniae]